MFGSGIIRGLGVTLREFVGTYLDDIKKIPSRYGGGREVIDQTGDMATQTGLFTIQYPEQRRKLPERFRYIPVLIYEAETGEDRCTACGICAKVCPPQCIWIVRDRDEKGKPITRPSEFYIDASICMNCGLCAEFCPFDAIKMNHDFEITAYERMPSLVFTMQELRVPTTYYASIRPTDYAEEEECRKAEVEKKAAAKAAPRPAPAAAAGTAGAAGAPPTTPAAAAPAAPDAGAPAEAGTGGPRKLSPEEMARLKAEAAARRAARAGEGGAPAEPAGGTEEAGPRKLSPEELERLRAEAAAKRAAKAAGQTTDAPGAAAAAPDAGSVTPPAPAGPRKLSPEEAERLRAEAQARRAAKLGGQAPEGTEPPVSAATPPSDSAGATAPSESAPAGAPTPDVASEPPSAATPPAGPRKLSPEEAARLRAEAQARRAAKVQGGDKPEGN